MSNPLSPSYNAQNYQLPEPSDSTNCSGEINATTTIERIYFAQTHAMEPSWPLFFLVAERPALIEVVLTGTGSAPEVKVQAFKGDSLVGELCLKGPDQLTSSVDLSQHRRDDRYTATLPSAWLRPDLSFTVSAGNSQRNFPTSQLNVGKVPELNLIMLQVDLFNYSKNDVTVPTTWLPDFAGAIPAARFRFGRFPVHLPLPKLLVSPDGTAPFVMDSRPCNSGESSSSCTPYNYDRMAIQAAITRLIEAIHYATGEYSYSYYYGHSGVFNPGGWGGNKHFVGADFTGIFLHEMGHALNLHHWNEGHFTNTSPKEREYRYPYGGVNNDGGGRGDSWNYYQATDEFISPICRLDGHKFAGLERSDAMQRNTWCEEKRTNRTGPWDGFGDFSAYAIFRFMKGAERYAGNVPYKGGEAPFHLPKQTGFPELLIDSSGNRSLMRSNQQNAVLDEERLDFLRPQSWDVPVATIYGSYHPSIPEANILYAPLEYRGTLPKTIDPTDPTTFNQLAAGSSGTYGGFFYWPKDLTFRITYTDGSQLVALYPIKNVDRNAQPGSGPWRFDLLYFAINIPGDKPIQRVELLERPFVVRSKTDTTPGNIANPSLGITPQNFLDGAKVVNTWERP
jgi:Peptidase M66